VFFKEEKIKSSTMLSSFLYVWKKLKKRNRVFWPVSFLLLGLLLPNGNKRPVYNPIHRSRSNKKV